MKGKKINFSYSQKTICQLHIKKDNKKGKNWKMKFSDIKIKLDLAYFFSLLKSMSVFLLSVHLKTPNL